uniref:hypothetical protein n=1 Tax=Neisseria sicca TaxID=490 RepID=UPI001C98FC6E
LKVEKEGEGIGDEEVNGFWWFGMGRRELVENEGVGLLSVFVGGFEGDEGELVLGTRLDFEDGGGGNEGMGGLEHFLAVCVLWPGE